MKTRDYTLASAILKCLERPEQEFGKEYSTTSTRVQPADFVQFAKQFSDHKQDDNTDEGSVTNGTGHINDKSVDDPGRDGDHTMGAARDDEGKTTAPQPQESKPEA